MQNIKQHKSTFAILGVLLLLFFSICISFFVSSVGATTNVTIENSGSRLNAKSDSTPTSYQWLISDTVDGTYSPIDGANQNYYDIKAEDEGKYIKVSADGSESETVGPIGKLIVMDIGKSPVTLGATYSGKDSDGNTVSGSHLSSNIYVITHRENGEKTTNSITEIPNNSKIVLELSDAKKNLIVNSAIDEKQVFTSVTGNTATISRDSAYTVSFTVENYSKDEYEELILHFNSSLPVGTTIILQDKSNGAYYWTEISAENVRELPLSVFVRMGDSKKTTFELTDGNMKLQFIIDFSQTNSGIAGDAVTTTLSAEPKAVSKALTGQSDETAGLEDVSSYKLTPGTATGEIVFSHTNSVGVASIWDGRDDALVFKPKSVLPADAHLSISLGGAKIVVYANCDGNFVYSMPDQATGIISVSLVSNLLGEGSETYPFEVDWIVAESKAEYSPMNAGIVATTEVNIQGVGQSPISLKIVGDKKLYSLNDTVSATVSWDGLPSNHKLEVVLMVKTESGDYSSTAVTKEIVFTQDSGTQTISISLAGNNAGSYRLYLTAELGLATVAEAEYYFIIN